MAAEAGFDVKVAASEFGTMINTTSRGDFELVLAGWSGLLDPDSNGYPFLHSGQALNITKYANPHADELLEGARRESDPARRQAIHEQLWRQEQADLPLNLSLDDAQYSGRFEEGDRGHVAGEWVAPAPGRSPCSVAVPPPFWI